MLFRKIKPIQHYFPDIHTALFNIEMGKNKYRDSKRFVLTDGNPIVLDIYGKIVTVPVPRGQLLGKLYIDAALAAIMYATGKEPKWHDLNTPSETYGWSFDDTRDLLSALDALSCGNPRYWNEFYGIEGFVSFKKVKNATAKK